ncbi:acyltransferase family protein [Noviherbaspirillum malthae]|jgi:peptidoglycan/LPS O-acetylase OafA/YrhL|uniref:acyltransferase family protein n=1 Tax=Noviherbaspirillum malthae TaxID=1260987 RepID=UPI00188DE0B3|nr:acyltransferase [Noviherbaspirillum malthae]
MHHFRFIDVLRIVAFNLIVLHHLAFYGPMADHVRGMLPGLIDWMAGPARIVVQIFLVIAGFLAARSFCPRGVPEKVRPLYAGMRRFLKLAPPFIVAMALAVFASMLASMWMDHYSLTALPDWRQVLAHALLLHDVLGVESLSAGAWYVAIDFQLYLLLACVLRFAAGAASEAGKRHAAHILVVTGVAASLFYFNRDAGWDAWAIYFFGSYGLGVLAWWTVQEKNNAYRTASLLALMLLIGGLALLMDFRSRIALALTIALLLAVVYRFHVALPARTARPARPWAAVQYFGRISYAVFLVHFPVCLLVNAAFTRFGAASAFVQGCGMLLAWCASIAAGGAFHRWVEVPLGRLFTSGRPSGHASRSVPPLAT